MHIGNSLTLKALSIALLTIVCFSSASAIAQQKLALGLTVADLDEESVSCGLDKTDIQSIAVITLRNNGIQAIANSNPTQPYMFIGAVARKPGIGGCAFGLQVTVSYIAPIQGKNNFKLRNGLARVELCSSTSISTANWWRPNIQTHAMESLGKDIKRCLDKLEY